MESKEVRIGNLVYKSLKSGNGRKIECKTNIHDLLRIEENRIFNYEPIEITEEWLLKFGFDKLDGCFGLQTKRGNLIIEEDLCEITGNYNDIGFDAPCKYVHQLQNLYFALTGEEL